MNYRLLDKIDSARLKNDEHFMYHKEKLAILRRFDAAKLGIAAEMGIYSGCFDIVDAGQIKVLGSELTAKIDDDDKLRDDIVRGLIAQTNSFVRHPLQAKRDAANRILKIFSSLGDIASKSLNAETATIINMVQLFETEYKADIAELNLGDWVTELVRLNNEIEELMTARQDKKANKSEVVLKSARTELDTANDVVEERIDAGVIFTRGGEDYVLCVRALNEVTAKYNALLAQRTQGKLGTKTKRWSAGAGAAGVSDEDASTEEKYPNARLWTNMVDVDDFKLGDICFVVVAGEKKYYEMIDESNFNLNPSGEEGHFGWKLLVI